MVHFTTLSLRTLPPEFHITDLKLGSHAFTLEPNLTSTTPTIHFPTTDWKGMNLFFKDSETNQSLSFRTMKLNSRKVNYIVFWARRENCDPLGGRTWSSLLHLPCSICICPWSYGGNPPRDFVPSKGTTL